MDQFYGMLRHHYRSGAKVWAGHYWSPNGEIEDGQHKKESFWFSNGKRAEDGSVQFPEPPKIWAKSDLYFAVNPSAVIGTSNQRVKIVNVPGVNVLFSEVDPASPAEKAETLERLKNFDPEPNVIVDSGRGFHAYWWLTQTFYIRDERERERAMLLQYAWITYTGGDEAAKDLARVLRVPGSVNTKYSQKLDVKIVHWNVAPDKWHAFGDLEELAKPLIQKESDKLKAHSVSQPKVDTGLDTDHDLVAVAESAKNGAEFKALMAGDLSAHNGDHSAADVALCNMLAFYTGRDPERMDRIFRSSGLMRSKWDEIRHGGKTYGKTTIETAVNSCTATYTGSAGSAAVKMAQQMAQNAQKAQNGRGASSGSTTQTKAPTASTAPGAQPGANLNGQPAQKSQPVTYPDIGREFVALNPLVIWGRSDWHRYAEGLWYAVPAPVMEKELWDLLETFGDDAPGLSSAAVGNVAHWLKSNLFVQDEDLDAQTQLINLRNGEYDLTADRLRPHRPESLFTTQLPYDYEAGALCPTWEYFIKSILVDEDGNHDPELTAFVQEAIGYSLTTDVSHQVSFWCIGKGANGKGVLFKVLQALSGDAHAALDVNRLMREQYGLARLAGKKLVTCSEIEVTARIADGIVKSLVAGDVVEVRQIRQEPFELQPVAKLWWAMNKIPTVYDTSDGFWRRFKPIPFRANFNPTRGGQSPIPNLSEQLLLELPGIFNWAIEGLKRLNQNGSFTKCKQVDLAAEESRQDSNPLFSFVDESCDVGPAYVVKSADLFHRYKIWAGQNGYRVQETLNAREFKATLADMGFQHKHTKTGNIYQGLKLAGMGTP